MRDQLLTISTNHTLPWLSREFYLILLRGSESSVFKQFLLGFIRFCFRVGFFLSKSYGLSPLAISVLHHVGNRVDIFIGRVCEMLLSGFFDLPHTCCSSFSELRKRQWVEAQKNSGAHKFFPSFFFFLFSSVLVEQFS